MGVLACKREPLRTPGSPQVQQMQLDKVCGAQWDKTRTSNKLQDRFLLGTHEEPVSDSLVCAKMQCAAL